MDIVVRELPTLLEPGIGVCGEIRNRDAEQGIHEEGNGPRRPPHPCTPGQTGSPWQINSD